VSPLRPGANVGSEFSVGYENQRDVIDLVFGIASG